MNCSASAAELTSSPMWLASADAFDVCATLAPYSVLAEQTHNGCKLCYMRTIVRLSAVAVIAILAALTAIFVFRSHSAPVPQTIRLPDGTEAFFLSDTRVEPAQTYPQPREIHVDGDAFLRVAAAAGPLIVRTRLLVLTITGASALRVKAYWTQTGEQVEVLSGHVQAKKSYPSAYREPDELNGGEMSMVNQTIDLMEKEKFDPAALRTWSEDLIASARRAVKRQ
jgi:ferric-dicitrate binding protein FerR (iron transport regulator)